MASLSGSAGSCLWHPNKRGRLGNSGGYDDSSSVERPRDQKFQLTRVRLTSLGCFRTCSAPRIVVLVIRSGRWVNALLSLGNSAETTPHARCLGLESKVHRLPPLLHFLSPVGALQWGIVERRRPQVSGSIRCSQEESYAEAATTSAITEPLVNGPPLSRSLESGNHRRGLDFKIITVNSSEELLAAATLRAQLFYSYPNFIMSASDGLEGIKERLSHDYQMRDLLKKRIKSEYNRDTKMQFLQMNVKCLLAVSEEFKHQQFLQPSPRGQKNSEFAPPEVALRAGKRGESWVAIGTLDIQDGSGTEASVDVNAITFQLFSMANPKKKKPLKVREICKAGLEHGPAGAFATEGESEMTHGYIFNLCVTATARRQGVATALMKMAVPVAQSMQLQVLYVHVEANNTSALALYKRLGYVVEDEESVEVEAKYFRPRRILLSFRL